MRSVKRNVLFALREYEAKNRGARRKEEKVRYYMRVFEVVVGVVAVAGSGFAVWAAIVAFQTFHDQRKAIELTRQSFELQREEFVRQAELNKMQTEVSKRTLIALSLETVRKAKGTAARKINIGQIEAIETLAALAPGSLRSLDLSNMYLAGVDLSGTNADLFGVKMCGANLENAKLNSVSFQGANLTGANLINAELTDVDLRRANLECANFDYWTAYFEEDPFNNPVPLVREKLCAEWMSQEERSFVRNLALLNHRVSAFGDPLEEKELQRRLEIEKENWKRHKEVEESLSEASGWETWGDKEPGCCGSDVWMLSSSIPPRSFPWRAKAQKSDSSLAEASIGKGVVKEIVSFGYGTIKPILLQNFEKMVNENGEPNACQPYVQGQLNWLRGAIENNSSS